jgi:hypothetical protein
VIQPEPDNLAAIADVLPARPDLILGPLMLALTDQVAGYYRRLADANAAVYDPDLARSLNNCRSGWRGGRTPRRRPRQQRVWSGGLPIWLGVGLALVGGLALAALFWDKEPWAMAATAGATVLLAILTAQLYSAAFAQLRASSRPLLVGVKPNAPLLPDLAHQMKPDKRSPDKKPPCYCSDRRGG